MRHFQDILMQRKLVNTGLILLALTYVVVSKCECFLILNCLCLTFNLELEEFPLVLKDAIS